MTLKKSINTITLAGLIATSVFLVPPVSAAELCGTAITYKQVEDAQRAFDAYAAIDAKLQALQVQGTMLSKDAVLEGYRTVRAEFERRLKTVKDDVASCGKSLAADYAQLDTYAKHVAEITNRLANQPYESASDTSIAFFDPLWHWDPTVNDPLAKNQYYIRSLGFGDNLLDGGKNPVTVAVIDDGVLLTHEDLHDAIWVNKREIPDNHLDDDGNGYIDDVYGWNFLEKNNDMTPNDNHGTGVASVIAAKPNNGVGMAGVGGNVRIMSLKACGKVGCSFLAYKAAIKYAADNGAKVINLSLGSVDNMKFTADLDDVIASVSASRGAVVVAAAGNGDDKGKGIDLSHIRLSPVCNDPSGHSLLGVSAVGSLGDLTPWSNYGNCVDVQAPGKGIQIASASSTSGYDVEDGTSFSAPLIAGMVARMFQMNPEITPLEVRQILKTHERLGMPYFADIVAVMKGTSVPVPVPAPAPTPTPVVTIPVVSGAAYVRDAQRNAAVSINADKALASADAPPCVSGTLIKGASSAAVYYCGANGKRFVFPNQQTYMSWYDNFDGVVTLTDEQLAKVLIGGLVTYRPGTRMLKITSDPTVYAVAANGELRAIGSEAVAARLYGDTWNKMIDDISDAFFVNYKVGATIDE